MTIEELTAMIATVVRYHDDALKVADLVDRAFGEEVQELRKKLDDKRSEVLSLRKLVEQQQDAAQGDAIVIQPCLSKGIAFLGPDAKTVSLQPFQVLRLSIGRIMIRIGRNALFFDSNGKFDGNECNPDVDLGSPQVAAIALAFNATFENDGVAPDDTYHPPGSAGSVEEMAGWPKRDRHPNEN